jgi:hypothetical protein
MKRFHLWVVMLLTLALLLMLQIPALADGITNPDSWRLIPGG